MLAPLVSAPPTRDPNVSILVFVELALDGQRHLPLQPAHTVSILVFVELALDV